MEFIDCINRALKNGEITKTQHQEASDLFIGFKIDNEANKGMSDAQANAQAAVDTFDTIKYQKYQSKRRMILQRAAQSRLAKNIDSYKGKNKGEGMIALLEQDYTGRATYSNVILRQRALRGMAEAMMDENITELRKSAVLGRTTKPARAKAKAMVREAFGENTGDESARLMAQAWAKAAEFLRLSFNKAGGDIVKRKDWGMPTAHDGLTIRKAGRTEWKNFIRDKLDDENMVSFKTNKPMTMLELEDVLDEIYDTISTDGFSKIKESSVGGQGKSLARRRQDHRFLKFKNADMWLEYQERFGGGDPFTIMISHLDTMARDVAFLEILGPNPNSSIRFMQNKVRRDAKIADAAAGNNKASEKAESSIYKFETIYDYITGTSNAPVNGPVARTMATLGNILTSAYLGSTSILAIATDPNFTRITKRMAGMSTFKSSTKSALAMLTANKATKQQAVRMGLIAEHWSAFAFSKSRYAGEMTGHKFSEYISNFALNVTLLSPFTQAGRWAFGMEFMGFIADNVKKPWRNLPGELQDTLSRYGFTEEMWTKLKDVPPYTHKGSTFLRPDDVMEVDRDLAFKMMEMIQGMTDLAVPNNSVRGRVFWTGKTRPGTIAGEMTRSMAMFKNFPVTFFLRNIQSAMFQNNLKSRASIGADLLISTTLMAGLAIQLREISKGRDELPMDSPEFWGKALLASGGLSIMGDFLYASLNEFGGGIGETISGPRTSFAQDLLSLTFGNLVQGLQGEETNIGRETIQFFGRNMPGSSAFYLRLAYERAILDQLTLMADPKARRRFRRIEKSRMKDYGQEYWWRPGQVTPDRPPNVWGVTGG